MVNNDLVKYLKEGKNRGFDFPTLRNKLLEAGFNEIDIDEANTYVPKSSNNEINKLNEKVVEKKQYNNSSESHLGLKSIKIAGVIGTIFIIMDLILIILALAIRFLNVNGYNELISNLSQNINSQQGINAFFYSLIFILIVKIATEITFYYGFIKTARIIQINSLKIGAWTIISSILGFLITFFIYQSIVFGLINITSEFNSTSIPGILIITFIIFIISLIAFIIGQLIFSIGLINANEEIKFGKISAILNFVSVFILTLVLFISVYFGIKTINDPGYLLVIFGLIMQNYLYIKISGIVFASANLFKLIFETLSLFNASRKFE